MAGTKPFSSILKELTLTLAVTCSLVLATWSSSLAASVTPEREIIPVDSTSQPQWKTYWDAGREDVRSGLWENAARNYLLLLESKPNIEVARWEYCQVLFQLGRYEELPTYLDALVEEHPNRNEYLAMAGFVSLENQEYEQAVQLLGQVYAAAPEGEDGVRVLSGIVDGMMALGKLNYVLPMMEQLRQRRPDDDQLLRLLAETSAKLGHTRKSIQYYQLLIEAGFADEATLSEAAELLSSQERELEAAALWEEIVRRNPANLDYQRKLSTYYLDQGLGKKALPALNSLIERDSDIDPQSLLAAARIYLYDYGRADRALLLIEQYQEVMPQHHEVRAEVAEVRDRIAEELLAIVENDGAERLWDDLEQLTGNRLEIYQLMADKLESLRKIDAAIAVLKVIYDQGGNKGETALRLANLYQKKGDNPAVYKSLRKVKSDHLRDSTYYKTIREKALLLGKDQSALDYSLKLLQKQPENSTLLLESLVLAGQLGDVEILLQLGESLNALLTPDDESAVDTRSRFLYAYALRINGLYAESEKVYRTILANPINDDDKLYAELEIAALLGEQGRLYDEHESYRRMLARSKENLEAAFAYIDSLLVNGDVTGAWSVYRMLIEANPDLLRKGIENRSRSMLFDAYLELLIADGRMAEVLDHIDEVMVGVSKLDANRKARIISHLDMVRCRVLAETGKYEECSAIVRTYSERGKNTARLRFYTNLAGGKGAVDSEKLITATLAAENGTGGVRGLFESADIVEKYGDLYSALEIYDWVLKNMPTSRRAKLRRAELLVGMARWKEASEAYGELLRQMPDTFSFYVRMVQLAQKGGNHHQVLKWTDQLNEYNGETFIRLLRTRALWATNRRDEALQEYESLLANPVNSRLQEKLGSIEDGSRFDEDKSTSLFWGLFYYDLANRLDNLNELNNQDGFLSLLETEEGQIVADLYAEYRMEELIHGEYQARKAIEERRYLAAEKQYRRSLREQPTTEGLVDLARVYERLGDVKKEGEVYSVLKERGAVTQELEESISRNRRQQAPILSADYEHLKKEGRDGYIDLLKESGGATLRFTPQAVNDAIFRYEELRYDDVDEEHPVDGRQFSAGTSFNIGEDTTGNAAIGAHILDSEGDSILLYRISIEHNFDDLLTGYITYGQEIVDDTVEALEESVSVRNLAGGLKISGETGFGVGGEYRRSWYSDDNNGNRLLFWTGYKVFEEFTTYDFRYSYELIRNNETNIQQDLETGETWEAGLPYWSPDDYWRHMFTFSFQHLLRDFGVFEKDPSFYSFEISAGYEAEGELLGQAGFDIFLEMGDSFLLKGKLMYTSSGEYDESRVAVSFGYRW